MESTTIPSSIVIRSSLEGESDALVNCNEFSVSKRILAAYFLALSPILNDVADPFQPGSHIAFKEQDSNIVGIPFLTRTIQFVVNALNHCTIDESNTHKNSNTSTPEGKAEEIYSFQGVSEALAIFSDEHLDDLLGMCHLYQSEVFFCLPYLHLQRLFRNSTNISEKWLSKVNRWATPMDEPKKFTTLRNRLTNNIIRFLQPLLIEKFCTIRNDASTDPRQPLSGSVIADYVNLIYQIPLNQLESILSRTAPSFELCEILHIAFEQLEEKNVVVEMLSESIFSVSLHTSYPCMSLLSLGGLLQSLWQHHEIHAEEGFYNQKYPFHALAHAKAQQSIRHYRVYHRQGGTPARCVGMAQFDIADTQKQLSFE